MSVLVQSAKYITRFALSKFDSFQAFSDSGQKGTGHLPHSVVNPLATYSPWKADQEFQRAHREVRGSTLVDTLRCYELWSLVAESSKLTEGEILEVGVWRGGTGCLIARQAKRMGIPCQVHLCDTFKGVAKAGNKDRHYRGGEHSDTSKAMVEKLAARMELENIRLHEGIFPEDTGAALESSKFRLCHIDVDVYQSCLDILTWVWPRLVPGGLIVYDDYGFLSTGGVTRAVNESRNLRDCVMLHNLNGHAVFVKTRNDTVCAPAAQAQKSPAHPPN
jgi:O-methyltransferase